VISNQAGLTLHPDPKNKAPVASLKSKVSNFKQKCGAILNHLNIPITIYAATAHDIFRKPRSGMWREICEDNDLQDGDIDLANSFFVGDAGGRIAQLKGENGGVSATAKDFSCSDRNFAHNIGLRYMTPEEYFLGQQAREFSRDFDLATYSFTDMRAVSDLSYEKKNKMDIVVFCGPPGAGKSTFYWKHMKPLGYERINQDILKSYEPDMIQF
jgi:bifunctional polynucleotide phosphatase/kinase